MTLAINPVPIPNYIPTKWVDEMRSMQLEGYFRGKWISGNINVLNHGLHIYVEPPKENKLSRVVCCLKSTSSPILYLQIDRGATHPYLALKLKENFLVVVDHTRNTKIRYNSIEDAYNKWQDRDLKVPLDKAKRAEEWHDIY